MGVNGVVRTGEATKLIDPVFILAAILISPLSRLLSDLLQPRLFRLTTPAYTVTFGFASAQLAKSLLMQQQL
jgi:hypothetical protein